MDRDDRRLFIFDCYDTLVAESSPAPGDPSAAFAEKLGLSAVMGKRLVYPILRQAFHAEVAQRHTDDVLRENLVRYGLTHLEDDAREALWEVFGAPTGRYRAVEAGVAALEAVRAAGHTARLISNCMLSPTHMRRFLMSLNLWHYFDDCLFSSAGTGKKPDPAFMRRAAAGTWATVTMVGDSHELDLAPAIRLGWSAVGIGGPDGWERLHMLV